MRVIGIYVITCYVELPFCPRIVYFIPQSFKREHLSEQFGSFPSGKLPKTFA